MKTRANRFISKYYTQHLLLTLVTIGVVMLFISMMSPFLETIFLAAIFSLGIYTMIEKLRGRYWHIEGPPPLKILIGSFTLLFLSISTLFAVSLLKLYNNFLGDHKEETRQTLQQIAAFATEKLHYLKPYADSWLKVFGIHDVSYDSALKSLPATVFGASAAFVSHIPDFVLQTVVFASMMLFFFVSHKTIYRLALRIKPFAREDVERITHILKQSSYESIMTNAMVGFLQATILTLGSAVLGFSEWSLIFSITFIFSFMPVIGGSSIAFLLALISLVSNHYTAAAGMAVVGCVSGISDNFLRSYIMTQSEKQTSSLLCFVSIIGAVYVFGFSGLFIGPFVISMCAHLMPHIFPKPGKRTPVHRPISPNSEQKSSLA